jgi:uncharacterized protein (TIGR02444 family)
VAEAPATPFWDYSLAVYARPGVAEACLALQDRHGLDVNILLFCCWAGQRGRALSAAELEGLMAAVGPWHEGVVKPLRAVRRWLKGQSTAPGAAAEALRQEVKAQELEAERIEQQILAETLVLGEGAPAAALAAANLKAYLAWLEVRAAAEDTADLAGLLTGCFEGLPPVEAMRMLA